MRTHVQRLSKGRGRELPIKAHSLLRRRRNCGARGLRSHYSIPCRAGSLLVRTNSNHPRATSVLDPDFTPSPKLCTKQNLILEYKEKTHLSRDLRQEHVWSWENQEHMWSWENDWTVVNRAGNSRNWRLSGVQE